MNCPHCGSEMKPEQVFCEKCGKERMIVPVFEPEIEKTVEESMSDIVKEIDPESAEKTDKTEDNDSSSKTSGESSDAALNEINKTENEPGIKINKQNVSFWVMVLIAMFVAMAVFSTVFFAYYTNSYDYQLDRANEAFKNKEYDKVIEFADAAIAIDENALEPRLLKISVYEIQGDEDTVVERCLAYLKRDPSNDTIYRKLIHIYLEREQYAAINSLLLECPVASVVDEYREFAAFPPEFDMEEGEYEEEISVKLLEAGNGSIYYTLDGSEATEYSDKYTAPISLAKGEYTINAIFVNSYGLVSKTATRSYTIKKSKKPDIVVTPDSGKYEEPALITVEIPDENHTVYYTTDKKDPTTDSKIYTQPIYMPIGKSEYRFLLTDNEGRESDVEIREYELDLKTDYTKEQAVQNVTLFMINRGDILDAEGHMLGSIDVKEYQFMGASVDKDGNYYYLVSEYIKNFDGKRHLSGNTYAFSLSDGSVSKAVIEDNELKSVEHQF